MRELCAANVWFWPIETHSIHASNLSGPTQSLEGKAESTFRIRLRVLGVNHCTHFDLHLWPICPFNIHSTASNVITRLVNQCLDVPDDLHRDKTKPVMGEPQLSSWFYSPGVEERGGVWLTDDTEPSGLLQSSAPQRKAANAEWNAAGAADREGAIGSGAIETCSRALRCVQTKDRCGTQSDQCITAR